MDYNMNIDWIWIAKNISLFTYLVFYFFITRWFSKFISEHEYFKKVLNNYRKPFFDNLLKNVAFFIVCVIGICIACVQLTALFAVLTGGFLGINLAILTLFISIPYGVYLLVKSIYVENYIENQKYK